MTRSYGVSLILALLVFATSADARTVAIRMDLRAESENPAELAVSGDLHLRHVGGEPVETAERTITVSGSAGLDVELPAGTWWRVRLETPGWWSPPEILGADAGARSLALFPTGRLVVPTRTAETRRRPESLTVRFQPPPRGVLRHPDQAKAPVDEEPRGEVDCRRDDEVSAWTCELPAGLHDLRFHAPRFASVFRWTTRVGPGESRRLDPLELIPGAALFGWLDWPSDGPDPADVRLRLTPQTLTPAGPQVERMASTAAVSERGLFQFRGLRPGSYRLTAEAAGWAPLERRAIDVFEGRETELRPRLELQPPASLEVCVTPAAPPGTRLPGDTWSPVLYPDRSSFRPPVEGLVGPAGCWTADDLVPGRYRLVVTDPRESVWSERPITLRPGPARFDVALGLVPIEGEIRRDGRPVRARLVFRQRVEARAGTARHERTVVLFSDPGGRFEGALPSEGRWRIGASFSAEGAEQALAAIDVEQSGEGAVHLRLQVSDVRLEGVVVDAAGTPVPYADVRLADRERDRGVSRARTDRRGRFTFDGVPPGSYELYAISRSGTAALDLDVREVPPPPDVRLVLGEQRRLAGTVLGPDGPVLGAQVQVYPDLPSARRVPVERATTDARGRFEIRAPADAVSLRVLVLAPGHAATALRVDPEAGSPLLLPVDRLAGTLVLDAGTQLPPSARLVSGGVPIFLSQLQDWLRVQGGERTASRWLLPGMAVGEYALCPPPSSASGRCGDGYLPPLGTTALSLETAAGVE